MRPGRQRVCPGVEFPYAGLHFPKFAGKLPGPRMQLVKTGSERRVRVGKLVGKLPRSVGELLELGGGGSVLPEPLGVDTRGKVIELCCNTGVGNRVRDVTDLARGGGLRLRHLPQLPSELLHPVVDAGRTARQLVHATVQLIDALRQLLQRCRCGGHTVIELLRPGGKPVCASR